MHKTRRVNVLGVEPFADELGRRGVFLRRARFVIASVDLVHRTTGPSQTEA